MPIRVSVCDRCGETLVPPRERCPTCRGPMRVATVDGLGEVVTHTTVHVVPEGFQAPVRVGLVRLDGGGQVLARSDVEIEMGARVKVEELPDGTHQLTPL
jgi:uncharacterized OB-fold protein